MENCKIPVAVIDDGINQDFYSTGPLRHNIQITRELTIQPREDYDPCTVSHGTTCAGIIKKYSPDAELSSIKILNDDSRRSNTTQLLAAIDWCADNGIRLVNMSLGTVSYKDRKGLRQCVERAVEKGLIIVAACDNYNIFTYPASLGNVIGVKCDLTETLQEGEYIYVEQPFDGVDIVSNARHLLTNHTGKSRTTSPCNSYAAPYITSVVYELLKKYPGIDVPGIKKMLRQNAVRHKSVDTYHRRPEQEYPCKSEPPVIMIYDFATGRGAALADRLAELFIRDGYEALAAALSGGEGYFEIRVLEDYFLENERLDAVIMEKVHHIYQPDIVICHMELAGADERLLAEVETNIEVDIKLVLAGEYEERAERLLAVDGGGDYEVIGVSGRVEEWRERETMRKADRIHWFDIGEVETGAEGLYKYILELFENDRASMERV